MASTGLFDGDTSSSDDDDNNVVQQQQTSKPSVAPAATGAGLFDADSSDSDSDDGGPSTTTTAGQHNNSASANADPIEYEDHDVVIDFATRPEEEATNPTNFEMLLARMPATVDVVSDPFAADQYDEAEERAALEARNKGFALNTVIRHRVDDRTGAVESNTRLVECVVASRL